KMRRRIDGGAGLRSKADAAVLAKADHREPGRAHRFPAALSAAPLVMAFPAAPAMAEPPRRPSRVMKGTPRLSRTSSCLASAAPTKATGKAMIAAGFGQPGA